MSISISSIPTFLKNIGTGLGLVKSKEGVNYPLKSLTSSNGVTLTETAEEINIDSQTISNGDGIEVVSDGNNQVISSLINNIGGLASIFKGFNSGVAELKTLKAGQGIDIVENSNDIEISQSNPSIQSGTLSTSSNGNSSSSVTLPAGTFFWVAQYDYDIPHQTDKRYKDRTISGVGEGSITIETTTGGEYDSGTGNLNVSYLKQ